MVASHTTSTAVLLGDAYCGTAPYRLSAAHRAQLLPAGALLVHESGCSGDAAGIEFSDDGSVVLSRAGRYTIAHCLAVPPNPPIHDREGDEVDHRGDRPNPSLRDAQFMCGVFGLLMINAILFFDVENRLANVKDFAINYASDMLAVGSILVLAELYSKGRRRERRAAAGLL